ncbi:hypothetical protein HPB52_005479 [Rhipicephalus sanguineus]|uniref:Transmembrane protein n=1 Tax=Rhipicephalus sanguineus TaxID=34632 RepID=A0A9D4PYJ6_RHISA|nr:hypothetical protein HPB52_005479 [Rhipicephalus sanguineus]
MSIDSDYEFRKYVAHTAIDQRQQSWAEKKKKLSAMEAVFEFVALRNQPGIQTMATIFFTFHSLFLMGQFLAVLASTDVMMHLKFASIDTSIPEICLVLVPRMLMLFATIVVDLLLVIGIEDDSQYAMKIFVNWSGLDVLVDSLICISLVVLKSNRHNGACAYLVRRYARARLADSSPKPEEEHEEHHGDEIEATTNFIKSASASESAASSPTDSLHHRAVKGHEENLGDSIIIDDLH